MPANPQCPICSHSTRKHGRTTGGHQRYLCPPCKKSFTPDGGGKPGPKVSGKAKTNAQRQAGYRKRHRM